MPDPRKSRIVFGAELVSALRSVSSVKWIALGCDAVEVTSDQALAIVAASLYQGKLNKSGRLVNIRQIPTRENLTAAERWDDTFSKTDGPVLQPSPEWFRRMGYNRQSSLIS